MSDAREFPHPRPDWAWFLDLDGTLLDIAASPMAVSVPPGLVSTLASLRAGAKGALAIVSGRPAQQVRMLLEPLRPATAGLHGLEMVSPDGIRHGPGVTLPPVGGLRSMLQDAVMTMPGVELENKGPTIALHYRGAPAAEPALRRLAAAAVERHPGFEILDGKMILEFRPAAIDKGVAVRRFMAQPPFAGRVPVFIGDDRTDEDAFAVVAEIGGVTIHVGDGRGSSAAWTIESPTALRLWLAECAESLRRARMEG